MASSASGTAGLASRGWRGASSRCFTAVAMGSSAAQGTCDEDASAEQTYRPHHYQERCPGRALGGPERTPQADGEGQRQEARDDEVGGLRPTMVTEGERA